MRLRTLLPSALLLLSAPVTALASTYFISGSGSFSSTAPYTQYSSPNGTFYFAFQLDSNPQPTTSLAGQSFATIAPAGTYAPPNGPSSSNAVPFKLQFRRDNSPNGNAFQICLSGSCSLGNDFLTFFLPQPL